MCRCRIRKTMSAFTFVMNTNFVKNCSCGWELVKFLSCCVSFVSCSPQITHQIPPPLAVVEETASAVGAADSACITSQSVRPRWSCSHAHEPFSPRHYPFWQPTSRCAQVRECVPTRYMYQYLVQAVCRNSYQWISNKWWKKVLKPKQGN